MQKSFVLAVVSFCAAATLMAADVPAQEEDDLVIRAGSATGFVGVVNVQQKVPESDLKGVLANLPDELCYVFRFSSNPAEVAGAGLVLKIVDDTTQPTLLAAPEEGWAQINVAKYAAGADQKTLAKRVRKAVLRGICYAAAAAGSGFPGNLMDVVGLQELDKAQEFIPVDTAETVSKHLAKRGVTPQERQTYQFACEEGWAPAPVNDRQRKIWDMVHTLPSEPIVIKPESQRK